MKNLLFNTIYYNIFKYIFTYKLKVCYSKYVTLLFFEV